MHDPIGSFFQQQLTTVCQKSLRDIAISFLQRENWQYTVTENPEILRLVCQGESQQWRCYIQVNEAEGQFIFYSVCPIVVPVKKLQAIAEYLTRANYGMATGNFELDFRDGEIRYKTSIRAQQSELNLNSIEYLVSVNVTMMERYLPGIIAVVEEGAIAERAIAEIES
ncbi:MAG: YbjN domain-containing protein [Cyanobacteria bacterium P01_C01_bin.72]